MLLLLKLNTKNILVKYADWWKEMQMALFENQCHWRNIAD